MGSCDIDDDAMDGVIDWTCAANVAGVSIVCLVDDIRLEDCLCKSHTITHMYVKYCIYTCKYVVCILCHCMRSRKLTRLFIKVFA